MKHRSPCLPSIIQRGFLVVLFCLCSAIPALAEDPPNIVLIISDDQSWTDFSFMGHEHIDTPNIDRLANRSLTYTRGYLPHGVCRPSLASLATGLYPHQHEIVGNDPDKKEDGKPYKKKQEKLTEKIDPLPKLPELLKSRNYRSLQTGKWWEGSYKRGGFTHGMTGPDARHGGDGLDIGRKGLDPIYNFIDEARQADQPYFVWYAPFLPHRPHNPPKKLLNKYKKKTDSIHIAKYWAMCEWFDQTVGDLLDHVYQKGDKNTMVVFVSDNGWIQKPDSGGYDKRSKRTVYEGGIRTPIMVHWPGTVEPSFDRTTPVSSLDIAPTILRAAGVEPPEVMPGVNLLDQSAVKQRDAIFGASYYHDIRDLDRPSKTLKRRYIISGWNKLLLPNPENLPDHPVELYNLKKDPHEKNNLAEQHPQRVETLRKRILNWWSINNQ